MNKLSNLGKKETPAVSPEPTTKVCPHCYSEINIKATRCPCCTSELVETISNEA
jgi:large conductance mechanosensitive channel